MTVSFPGLGIDITVNRVAFTLFGIDVYWYGVCISIGVVLALLYAFNAAKEHKVNQDKLIDVIMVGLLSGIIGARLFFVIFKWDDYSGNLMQIFNYRDGGVAIYGGIIFGIIGGYIMTRIKKINPLPILDIVSVSFLIGQGIGRWGNFFNQEAFGINTSLPWGMYSEGTRNYLAQNAYLLTQNGIDVVPTSPVHPCFLYESIWCLLGIALLLAYRKRRKFDGEMFLIYIGWYGFARFIIEGLRTDSLMFYGIRISQAIALVCVITSVILIAVNRKKLKKSEALIEKNVSVGTGTGLDSDEQQKTDAAKKDMSSED